MAGSFTRLDEYDNTRHRPGALLLKRAAWQLINVLILDSWAIPFSRIKVGLLRSFGAHIGTGVVIKPRVSIKYPWRLKIGDHVWIGERVWIDNLAEVRIGSHVCISQDACFITGNHDYRDRKFALITKPIEIEDGAWVGARSTLCPGVHLKKNSVLTVGSILTQDTHENGIYSGNPAAFMCPRLRARAPE